MDSTRNDSSPRAPLALVLLTALVYVAGFAMVAAWFALLLLGPGQAPAAARSLSSCSICGVVERVAEYERSAVPLSGDQGEGFVLMLAALGGGLNAGTAPGRIYETAVLHDDGSVRVVRDTSVPHWKRGDRVRVLRGRVEPAASAEGAPGAAPAGRTPSPVPPIARAP
jgi:hypothetical protein